MDRHVKNFIVKILIAAAVLVVLAWFIFNYLIPGQYLPVLPWMLAFFTIVAVSVHAWQVHLSKKDLGVFTRSSMLISMFRLMLYSVFAIAYLAVNQNNVAVFVVSLVVVYTVYTMLEIIDLSRIVRRK